MSDYQQAEKTAVRVAGGLEEIADTVEQQLQLGEVGAKLRARAATIRADRFNILVLGEFSRGKSTLLNALLGTNLLPQMMTPSTAIVTVLRYGDEPGACVYCKDGREEPLSVEEFRRRFVLNKEDTSEGAIRTDRFDGISHAVVTYPLELCRHRVELVDSPGLEDDPKRTLRTRDYLKHADAVVLVLDATQLFNEKEDHFLETVLLPGGFKNIFFVVNRWNLIGDSVLDPADADREREALEARIRHRLTPFCFLDGRDRSAERIFRIDALGALKARLSRPVAAARLAESGVPAFEAALQQFLVEERTRERNHKTGQLLQTTSGEAERAVAMQLALADSSVAQIEAQRVALQPKLEKLRGIRKHILAFLDTQANNLQDRLVISLHDHVKRIEATLPEEVEKFDLSVLKTSLTWKAITNPFREEENKFERQVERALEPQIKRLLERRFGEWHQSVAANEMRSVLIDVEKHLQEEAAEYQRVLREIDEKVGSHVSPVAVGKLLQRWLGGDGALVPGGLSLTGTELLGDMGWLIGGIVAEVVAEVLFHVKVALFVPVVGLVVSAVRLLWREASLQQKVREKIVEGTLHGLREVGQMQAARLRQTVREGFEGLKAKIGGSIDEEIAVIDGSMQAVLEQRRQLQFSAEREKERLEQARAAVAERIAGLRLVLKGAGD